MLLITLILVLLLYFVVDRPIGKTHVVSTKLDSHIPLIEAFAIPYLLFLPMFIGTILYAYIAGKEFEPLAESIIIAYALSYVFYVVYQTHVPRPKLIGHDFYTNLVRWIYAHDKPYNCLPSTHSSGATILAVYYITVCGGIGWLAAIFCLVIVISTLLVKQHYILDAISGVALGLIVCSFAFGL